MLVFSPYKQATLLDPTQVRILTNIQTVDVILAWLAAEDNGAMGRIKSLLADRDESLQDVKVSLQGTVICFRGMSPACTNLSQNNLIA